MNTYETVFITVPTLTEETEKSAVDSYVQVVTDGGGTLFTNDRMGRRRLAYPINKCEDGVFTRLLYDSGSDVPRELERRMKLSDKVLRVLTVKLEKEWAVEAKEQAERDEKAKVEAAAAAAAAAVEAAAAAEAKAAEEAKAEAESADAERAESERAESELADTPEPVEIPEEVEAESDASAKDEIAGEDAAPEGESEPAEEDDTEKLEALDEAGESAEKTQS